MSTEIDKLKIKGIIRRRKRLFLVTFMLILCAFVVTAFVLPPIYKSEALITVENQEIPEEYVTSNTSSFVSERLKVLERKILINSKLREIIKTYALYPELKSEFDRVSRMRGDILFETVDISTYDKAKGGWATIAFTLAYQSIYPEKAQAVTNLLANLFIDEDQSNREQRAMTTTAFLEKEVEELHLRVKDMEEKISRFKATNINQLPGSTGAFQQMIFRLDQDIANYDNRIQNLSEKIVYLKSQIANIDPLVPILTEKGTVAANPSNRLKFLRLQLIQMQSQVSDKHPDIIRLKSEIKELEAQVGSRDTTSEQVNRLTMVEKQLAESKGKYGDKHPDVVRLSKEADLLSRQIEAGQTIKIVEAEQSDNPGYMNIKAQIIVAESEIQTLRAERDKASMNLEAYQKRLEKMPFIDEEFNALTLNYAAAKKKFNDVSENLHKARLSQQLDTSEQGARFSMTSPAYLPGKPYKPKRLLIMLAGFMLGLGSAVTLAALAEGLDKSMKTTDELESIAGVPVLVNVSFFDSPLQKRMRRYRQLMAVGSLMIVILVASLMINWFVMPIGDLWAKFEDRLVEIGVPIEKESKKM